jgi:hypothetical protein
LDGIKEIMQLIEECQDTDDFEIIYICCGMLSTIFMYGCGIDFLARKPRKYFEKFFELSAINEFIKRQCIRTFLTISNNMSDCFDNIDKSAV